MTKADKLYERAALCHQQAGKSSKEAEKKGWFDLACIWLMLADSVSGRIECAVLELTAEQMLAAAAAKRQPVQIRAHSSI